MIERPKTDLPPVSDKRLAEMITIREMISVSPDILSALQELRHFRAEEKQRIGRLLTAIGITKKKAVRR